MKTRLDVECLGCHKAFSIENLDMSDPADRKKVDNVMSKGAYCPTCNAQAATFYDEWED